MVEGGGLISPVQVAVAARLLIILTVAFLLWHCGGAPRPEKATAPEAGASAADVATGPSTEDTTLERAERHWNRREHEPELRQAIEIWEGALARSGEDATISIRLSRAYHLLSRTVRMRAGADGCGHNVEAESSGGEAEASDSDGDAFTDNDAARRIEARRVAARRDAARRVEALELLARGTELANRAVETLAPGLLAGLLEKDPARTGNADPGEQAVRALCWRGVNLHEWASLQGYAEAVARQQEVRAAMQICLRRAPDLYHGGPHRYFGAHFAQPLYPGDRDLERSREHFERALAIAPDFLENRLDYARYYAVAAQDHKTFAEQLAFALREVADAAPGLRAENRLQRLRADKLSRRAADLFE